MVVFAPFRILLWGQKCGRLTGQSYSSTRTTTEFERFADRFSTNSWICVSTESSCQCCSPWVSAIRVSARLRSRRRVSELFTSMVLKSKWMMGYARQSWSVCAERPAKSDFLSPAVKYDLSICTKLDLPKRRGRQMRMKVLLRASSLVM